MNNKKTLKTQQYSCDICHFITNNKKDFRRHILTPKHINNNNNANIIPKKTQHCKCLCGKEYRYISGLSAHKKKCESAKTTIPIPDHDVVKELIKQNQYLIMENKEFKTMLFEMASKTTTNINNTVNNTNSHNKQFNLQFFLNETCKNAMNLSDFVNSIVIQASELEDMGKLGYVQGISNIMIRSLKELDETERPFHCTDKKREVIYIKENNVWEKETSDRAKLHQFVKDIAYRNFKRMPQWEKDNPKFDDITTKKHLEYIRMLNQVMTGLGPEEIGVNKIIRNLSAHVYLDK